MKGYALQIENEFLDLFPNQEITITEENTLTNEKLLVPNTTSFKISLPVTPKNLQILGNHKDIQQFDLKKSVAVNLFLFGEFYCQGTLAIESTDENKIETQFVEFDYQKDLKDKKLADLDFPVFDLSIDEEDPEAPLPEFLDELSNRNNIYHLPHPNKDFVAPTIENPAAIGVAEYHPLDAPEDKKISTPYQNLYLGQWDKVISEYPDLGWSYPIIAVTPMPFITWVLKIAFRYYNINISQNDIVTLGFHNLIMYSNRALILFNKLNVQYGPTNFYEPSYNFEKIRPYENELKMAEFMPDCSIQEFLTSVLNTFNLFIVGERKNNKFQILSKSLFFQKSNELDISNYTIINSKTSYIKNKQIKKINWKDYFSENINKDFNYRGEVNTVSELPNSANKKGDVFFVKNMNGLYFFSPSANLFGPWLINNLISNVNYSKNIVSDLEIDTNSDTIGNNILPGNSNTKYFAKAAIVVDGEHSVQIAAPYINQSLATKNSAYDKKPSETPNMTNIVFLMYRGMIDSPDDFSYPYASSGSADPFFPLPGSNLYDKHLNMFGAGGIYETFWKDWILNFKPERETTIDLVPNSAVWKEMFTQKLRIGNQLYIATKKTIKLTPNSIKSCQAEVIQLRP